MDNFGTSGQRHAVLGLLECLHPALHDDNLFGTDLLGGDGVICKIWINFGQILCT